jgi:hypothetical protein
MRISTAPVLKYGARLAVKSSASSLVLVSPLLSPLQSLSDSEISEGTGGTIAGCGQFLKSMADDILVVLADPEGSGLYNKVSRLAVPILYRWLTVNNAQVKHGVMYDRKESEGTRRRHQVDTVVEGIGINRITKNIELALPAIDDAFRWSASILFVFVR